MITVWKVRGKSKKLVGCYNGNNQEYRDMAKALDQARVKCPTGRLVASGPLLLTR